MRTKMRIQSHQRHVTVSSSGADAHDICDLFLQGVSRNSSPI